MASSCPINMRTQHQPPQGSIIRATPTYIRPEHLQEVVQRCPNHALALTDNRQQSSAGSSSPAPPTHLVRCEHLMAQYCRDIYTGRLSVTVPHENPQPGSPWVVNVYQFMCFSSCLGGLNRRPLQIVFTLEHQGKIIGRQAVEVRICACPSRDRKSEENAMFPASSRPPPLKRFSSSSLSINGIGKFVPDVPPKKTKVNGINTEEYILKVRGKENFEMLSKLRDSLEIAEFFVEHKEAHDEIQHTQPPGENKTQQM